MPAPLPDYGLTFDNTQQTLLKAEVYAEKFIKDFLSLHKEYDLPKSQLWGIKNDGQTYLISQDRDVYDLLRNSMIYDTSECIGVIVHTTGWAAPLNKEGDIDAPPSEHLERRRIALAACVTHQSVGSALYFIDTQETILDPGSATGSLAEALSTFWNKNSSPF